MTSLSTHTSISIPSTCKNLRHQTLSYSTSIIAVNGRKEKDILKALDISIDRRELVDIEIDRDEKIIGVLGNGLHLIIDRSWKITEDNNGLARLSAGAEVFVAFIEEHSMFSECSCWKDGSRVWSVTHSLEKGRLHLDVDGEFPSVFRSIKLEIDNKLQATAKGEAPDFYFSIPVELFRSITGFDYVDSVFEMTDEEKRSFKYLKDKR